MRRGVRSGTMAVLAVLILAGCMAPVRRPPVVGPGPAHMPDASSGQDGQTPGMQPSAECTLPRWQMSGRVAVSNGRQGGSGRIDWQQGGGQVHVQFSAPVTRQSWVLDIDADGGTLQGVAGGPRRGEDPAALLHEVTGWEIPVTALGCWLRGVPAPEETQGEARVLREETGVPQQIEQAGWVVTYGGWVSVGRNRLPARIEAVRGQDRVRLVVDHWQLEE